MAVKVTEDESWRVVLLPGLEKGRAAIVKSFTLPDPRTGRPQGYLLVDGSLLEVNRFKQSHSAWLVGDRLLADGGMFLATAYDPLFVLLPILDRGRDKDEGCPAGKFKALEELLYDVSAPALSDLLQAASGGAEGVGARGSGAAGADAATGTSAVSAEGGRAGGAGDTAAVEEAALTAAAGSGADGAATAVRCALPTLTSLDHQLACICDVREVDGTRYYRLNEDRVLGWLCCKFRRMQAALSPQLVGMEAPYAAAYVLAFMGEYVGDPWVGRVAKRLGINEKELQGNNNGTTLQPTDGNTIGTTRPGAPLAGGPPEKKQKTDPRAAAKQAALAKQAVGTKKMTSFFTKT